MERKKRPKRGGGHLQSKKCHSNLCIFTNFREKAHWNFQKSVGGGQRPFKLFSKNIHIWGGGHPLFPYSFFPSHLFSPPPPTHQPINIIWFILKLPVLYLIYQLFSILNRVCSQVLKPTFKSKFCGWLVYFTLGGRKYKFGFVTYDFQLALRLCLNNAARAFEIFSSSVSRFLMF